MDGFRKRKRKERPRFVVRHEPGKLLVALTSYLKSTVSLAPFEIVHSPAHHLLFVFVYALEIAPALTPLLMCH